jgi:hypothetical protein
MGALGFERRAGKVALIGLAVLAALVLSSCGGGESQPPEANNLVGQAELEKYPPDSAARSFLELWSDLQYQSWAEVAAYYSPGLRRFIGTEELVGAKKVDASTFPVTKPEIGRIKEDGPETTIYYSMALPGGTRELGSTTWRKEGGNWEMIYDSRLDAELNQFARNRVETEEHGAPSTEAGKAPSAAASRAGIEAAHLQSEYLEGLLERKKS